VRITAMREDDSGKLEVDAEDFPWGTANAYALPAIRQERGMWLRPILIPAQFQRRLSLKPMTG